MWLITLIIVGIASYKAGRGDYKDIFKSNLFQPLSKGEIGEKMVINELKRHFPKKDNYLINNVTLKTEERSTQIDHILINQFGIFVIETKHYSGWIYGNEKKQYWTQTYQRGKRFQFYNPIKQNEAHINKLRKYLSHIPRENFTSIIVFTGDGTIRNEISNNTIYLEELVTYIKKFKSIKLEIQDIHTTIGRIEYHRKEISKQTDEEHIRNIYNSVNKTSTLK